MFTQQGRVSYRSRLGGGELTYLNNGHVYKYPISVKGNWTSEEHAILIGNDIELSLESNVYRNTEYFSFGGFGADYATIGNSSTHYGADDISAVQDYDAHLSGNTPKGDHLSNTVEYLSNPNNGYVKVNETRTITTYTPGVITIDYYYTKDAPARHSVTRNYGSTTDNVGNFAEGAIVKASDLGAPDVAQHTADIQAYFGDKYNEEHPYSFSGWYLDKTRTTKLPSDGMVMPDRDVTVYAGWIDETEASDAKVTVTTLVAGSRTNFSRAVGTVFGNFNIPVSTAAEELNQDGRTGDVLLGWYRENDEYRTVIQPTEPITEDITVRPLILQAGETFDIIYDMNGIPATDNPIYGQPVHDEGSGKYKTTQGYYPGANATVASVDSSKLIFASKPSYAQFYCWNTKADGTGDSYFPDETVKMPSDGDLTLYAMYSPYMNTSLVYELGYDNAPNIDEADRTVVFKDYKDENRAAHELYTNSTYNVETQYRGETEPYYDRLLFDGKTINLVRPGYTFLGWLDKAAKADYAAADADHQEAMLLHYEDKIRANAPTVGENGQLEKEYLEAQWKQDVLKVNVYTASNGQWNTNATLVKEAQYTTETENKTLDLAAGDGTTDNQGPGHTFATGAAIGYEPTANYPIYGLAAVNGTVVTSLKYQAKGDGSGYAWTYTKDGKTVEMTATDTLNLYYVPYPADVKVKYRIVYDGEYLTEDTSTGNTVNVKAVIGKEFDEKTYLNIDLGNPATVEAFAVASGYTDKYELVGVFHGSRFDMDKSIEDPKKIYYKNGELRINSADGDAVDDGEIYVVYHNKANTMVEAGYATVANENDTIVTTMQEGKTYVDVPKGGSRDLTQPDYNNYDKYDIAVGSVSGETATVSQDGVTKLTANEDGSVISVSGGNAFGANEILIFRYYEPRTITAYVFAYDWSGTRAYQRKETLNITADGITASGDNPGGKALDKQKLLSPVDDYELSEVYLLEDKGGNISEEVTSEPDSSVIDRNIANASEGIALTKTLASKIIAADDQALYFVYTPKFREVQVRYLKWTEDGYVPLEGGNDKTVKVPLEEDIDFSSRSVTYGDQTYELIPTVSGYTPAAKNFIGTSKDDLTELSSRTGDNRTNGFYVQVDESDKRLTNVQKIFYIYYPDPRTVNIHFVEKKLNGDLEPITGFDTTGVQASVTAAEPVAMTKAGIEGKVTLTSEQQTTLASYGFIGAYVGGTNETDFAPINKAEQTVTDRTLANEIDGLTFTASADPEMAAMLLGNRDIYAVYYPEPRQVPAHAVIYNNGKLTQNDALLTEAQKMVSVESDGTTVSKIPSETVSEAITDDNGDPITDDNGDPVTETHIYTGMGVSYGPTAAGLDIESIVDSMTLKNSPDGANVMNGEDVTATLDMNDAVYYIFYPDPRDVKVYFVAENPDGTLVDLKQNGDAEAAAVTSGGVFKIAKGASGQSAINIDAVRTLDDKSYDFKYIAVGPDMGKDYNTIKNPDYDEDQPEGEGNEQYIDVLVVATGADSLRSVSESDLYLKNETAAVNYSTKSNMTDAEPMTTEKPAIYIVYKPYVKLTVTKAVVGQYGDLTKDFTFKLEVTGAPGNATYNSSKNGTVSPVSNGGNFTLKNGESIELTVPKGVEIKLTETVASGYTVTLGTNTSAVAAVTGNEVKFTLGDDDATLDIVNTFDDGSVVPSGIARGNSILIPLCAALILALGLALSIRRKRRLGIRK